MAPVKFSFARALQTTTPGFIYDAAYNAYQDGVKQHCINIGRNCTTYRGLPAADYLRYYQLGSRGCLFKRIKTRKSVVLDPKEPCVSILYVEKDGVIVID